MRKINLTIPQGNYDLYLFLLCRQIKFYKIKIKLSFWWTNKIRWIKKKSVQSWVVKFYRVKNKVYVFGCFHSIV